MGVFFYLFKMDKDERKKIREIMSKKDDSKMDWMYKGSQPETNEYLLGRKIDKYIEKVPEPTKEEKYGAAFCERIKANIELDMAAKMREDPLFQIRKREEEARRRILDNPVKMKQIQKMIKEQKEERQKSKSKKKKKNKSCDDDDDDDDDQSGDELVKTYLSIISKKHQDKHDGDKKHHQEDRGRPSGYGLQKHHKVREAGHSSRRDNYSKPYHRQDDSTRNRTSSEPTSKYSKERFSTFHSHHSQRSSRPYSQSRSPQHSRSRSPRPSNSGKLKDTEREKKLREMMENAKWRNEVRQKNMKNYEEECAKEEKNAQKGSSSDFLNPMMSRHAAQSSVEERIRRNKYNIQRTKMQLNRNFNER